MFAITACDAPAIFRNLMDRAKEEGRPLFDITLLTRPSIRQLGHFSRTTRQRWAIGAKIHFAANGPSVRANKRGCAWLMVSFFLGKLPRMAKITNKWIPNKQVKFYVEKYNGLLHRISIVINARVYSPRMSVEMSKMNSSNDISHCRFVAILRIYYRKNYEDIYTRNICNKSINYNILQIIRES